MSFQCLDPYVAVSLYKDSLGKHTLKLYGKTRLNYNLHDLKESFGSENVFVLPCGTCESCRRNRAEDWAVRCSLEAKEHPFNYFLTLTYDDNYIFKSSKDDLNKFFDRLEGKDHKNHFKYFACQEYGELTNRKHYHCVLFCDFELDLRDPVKVGNFYQYKSSIIDKAWNFGLYTLSPFGVNCARYVAKYTAKNSKLFMSRNLGKSYFEKHYEEIKADHFRVYADFGNKFVHYVPQCFIKWFEQKEPGIAGDFVNFKKSLAHTVQAEKMRSLLALHEEEAIAFDQALVKEKGKNRRLL